MASRLQVAQVLAGRLADGRPAAVRQAAAWLVSTGRARQAEYLAKDVAALMARQGHVLVQVTAARPLNAGARARLEAGVRELTGATTLELHLAVQPELIGGVVIETPGAILDTSVRTKLAKFVDSAVSRA